MHDMLIRKMQGRIDQCRRLAKFTTDHRTATALLQMAEEGEADVRRLLAEGEAAGGEGNAPTPSAS